MAQRTVKHAANGKTAKVIAVIEICDQKLKCLVRVALGRRDVLQNRFKERPQVIEFFAIPAFAFV